MLLVAFQPCLRNIAGVIAGALLSLHPPVAAARWVSLESTPAASSSLQVLGSVTGATAFQPSLNIANKDSLSTSFRDRGRLLQSLLSLRKPRVILG